jgi:type I restriction enzyme M protein
MRAIERENEDLRGVLPTTYTRFSNSTLVELLKLMSSIPIDIEGDAFGKIYEYFLGHFAMSEGRRGGVFYTPTSIVRLIVEILEPHHGRIYDPACGSGGMFVQSARFVENHRKVAADVISIYGSGGNRRDGSAESHEPRGARPLRRCSRSEQLLRGSRQRPLRPTREWVERLPD